ncbi:MAG: hypothetical protein WCJ74_01465 [bacterium]
MKRFLTLCTIILLFIFCLTQKINAQAAPTSPVEEVIITEIVPEVPQAFQDVNISIESYSYDLSRSKIDWYINGVLRESGISKKSFNFTTGDVGSVSNIIYKIKTPEGVSFQKTITISPGNVDLLWESTGYTPPFYKGKSLYSFEGQIRLVAIPNLLNKNGVKYKPEELVYTWKRGMGTDTEASGYGKNIFYWNGGIVSNDEEISVDVSDLQDTTRATASIIVNPKETEIFAYENNPSLGILFNKAIQNNFDLKESEVSITAIPYYFNNPDVDGIYSWFVNDNQSVETTRDITFRNTTGEEGYSNISFDLSNQKRILQSASGAFDLYFGTKSTNPVSDIFKSFFGGNNN